MTVDISWRLAFRNLLRNRRRTLATGLAILFGFAGLILTSAYIYRVKMGLEASTVYMNHKGHLALLKEGALELFQSRPKKYLISADEQRQIREKLNNFPEVEFSGAYLTGMGLLTRENLSTPFIAMGIEPEVYSRIYQHPFLLHWAADWFSMGQKTDYEEFVKNPNRVSVTVRLAQILDLHAESEAMTADQRQVQLVAKNYFNDLNAASAELGSFHTTGLTLLDDSSLRAPLRLIQDLYSTEGIEYLALFLKDSSQTSSIMKRLQIFLQENDLKLQVVSYFDEKWSPYYVGTMSFLYVMGIFFVVLICGAVALSIVNSTAMGVLERTREIGTMRALGFEPLRIQSLFIRESFLLSSFSIALGLIFSAVVAFVVDSLDIRFQPPGTEKEIQFLLVIHPALATLMAVILILITVITAYGMTRNKCRAKVIHLLADSGA